MFPSYDSVCGSHHFAALLLRSPHLFTLIHTLQNKCVHAPGEAPGTHPVLHIPCTIRGPKVTTPIHTPMLATQPACRRFISPMLNRRLLLIPPCSTGPPSHPHRHRWPVMGTWADYM